MEETAVNLSRNDPFMSIFSQLVQNILTRCLSGTIAVVAVFSMKLHEKSRTNCGAGKARTGGKLLLRKSSYRQKSGVFSPAGLCWSVIAGSYANSCANAGNGANRSADHFVGKEL